MEFMQLFDINKNIRAQLEKTSIASAEVTELHPDELRCYKELPSSNRKRNFLLGRIAARRAIERSGFDAHEPILIGNHGIPSWPKGIKGSISHTKDTAFALMSQDTEVLSLGCDVEAIDTEFSSGELSQYCTEKELSAISQSNEPSLEAIKLFTAKEAFFKAWFPIIKKNFWYKELELTTETIRSGYAVVQAPKLSVLRNYNVLVSSFNDDLHVVSCAQISL